MGPPTAQPDQRSLHVYARTPCSATLEASRPNALQDNPTPPSLPKKDRPKLRPAIDDFSDFTNHSTVIRSSHPPLNSPGTTAENSWSPVLYDPNSDSVRIIPPRSRTPLVSQFREFKDKINGVKHGVHAHRLVGLLSSERPESQALPLRAHEAGHARDISEPEIPNFVQPSAARLGRTDWKDFDLMAPPPGRKRSSRMTQDDSAIRPSREESEDANPSKALTSQIASSIMQERHHVRGTEAAPLPVPRKESRRNAPTHRGTNSTPIAGSRSSSVRSVQKARSLPPSRRPSEDNDDPFLYDNFERHELVRRASPPNGLRIEKEAEADFGNIEYPCPFRRRNPILFNVRTHEQCAQRPFADISELKRHIRAHHRRRSAAHLCPRCKVAFRNDNALMHHLTVSVDQMCEPRPAMPDHLVEDGISESTDIVLGDGTIKSWEELWWLLFPQDAAVLEPEFSPVVEAIEAEQEFDDSAAELKSDLCDALKRILPEQVDNGPLFQVLAGQIQLVLEQHRAKVLRKCRTNASNNNNNNNNDKTASVLDRPSRPKTSRFSVANSNQRGRRNPSISLHSDRTRRAQHHLSFAAPLRASISPASSVYSQGSGGSRYASRANSFSSSVGALYVESPRLPFRDWVHNVKFDKSSSSGTASEMGAVSTQQQQQQQQRDSGLALQCDECRCEECQCGGSYADQLSAFLTPAVGVARVAKSRGVEEDSDEDVEDWAGGPVTGEGRATGKAMRSARGPGVQRMQGEFI